MLKFLNMFLPNKFHKSQKAAKLISHLQLKLVKKKGFLIKN